MKRLLPLLLLAGCAVSETAATTTLVPLNPDGKPKATVILTLPGETTYPPNVSAFFDDAVYYNDGPTNLDNRTMLDYAELWCQLMEDGMQDTDVVERINEGGTDTLDRRQHFAIVIAGIENICPSQQEKAEYIALNFPVEKE